MDATQVESRMTPFCAEAIRANSTRRFKTGELQGEELFERGLLLGELRLWEILQGVHVSKTPAACEALKVAS